MIPSIFCGTFGQKQLLCMYNSAFCIAMVTMGTGDFAYNINRPKPHFKYVLTKHPNRSTVASILHQLIHLFLA